MKNDNKENEIDEDYDLIYVSNDPINTSWETELNQYLMSPRAPKDTDVLMWWKCNADVYPNIAKMARDYLCIPATSVPCERVFSEAGNVVTKLRCNLSKEKIRALICIYG